MPSEARSTSLPVPRSPFVSALISLFARLRFCLIYFAGWMVYFALIRLLFLAYEHSATARLGFSTVMGTFVHGARMDAAASAYVSFVAFIFVTLTVMVPARVPTRVLVWLIGGFTALMLVLISLLATIDLETYRNWGFRLDGTPLLYLSTPREALASAGSSPLLLLVLIFLLLATTALYLLFRHLLPLAFRFPPVRPIWMLPHFAVLAYLTYWLYVPAKGGYQQSPMTQGMVYFSPENHANQAAVNVAWNFFDSVWWKSYIRSNPYQYLPDAEALSVADSVLTKHGGVSPRLVRGTPNVILIIWESFSAKVVERLGGVKGVTPIFDSLIHEGILFDSVYATGDRSAKGLTGILSGYPAQPRTTIMQFPSKTASLPALPRDLRAQGYNTGFYYGGEPEFANIKSYLVNAGFDSIVGKQDFDAKDWNSKWGAHDHVVFGRMLRDLAHAREPFFRTLFTLSSHEPFEVPVPTAIPGATEQSLFLNAHHYTDQSLGNFLRAARAEPWWNRTLVIIIADHGHRLPVLSADEADQRWATFHIPMLWIGGALTVRDTVIHTIGSQTDLTPTLLGQLGLDAKPYYWGRNLLSPTAAPLAYFTFQDGFGLLDANGALTFDNVSRSVMYKTGNTGAADVRTGQALLQASIDDYVKR